MRIEPRMYHQMNNKIYYADTVLKVDDSGTGNSPSFEIKRHCPNHYARVIMLLYHIRLNCAHSCHTQLISIDYKQLRPIELRRFFKLYTDFKYI